MLHVSPCALTRKKHCGTQGCARLMSRESNLTRLWLKWVESKSSRPWKWRIWVESESNHADRHLSQSWVNWILEVFTGPIFSPNSSPPHEPGSKSIPPQIQNLMGQLPQSYQSKNCFYPYRVKILIVFVSNSSTLAHICQSIRYNLVSVLLFTFCEGSMSVTWC